ncbi:MAG: chromosome partitioning protein, partial [Verrucomicrobia bacterium]|nr:chromosome partitioning protein [Verrucomicrobiota bacterium]
MSKPALGRGLGALMGGGIKSPFAAPSAPGAPAGGAAQAPSPVPLPAPAPAPPPPGSLVRKISRDRIRPSALQPRKEFPQESLAELADSIR